MPRHRGDTLPPETNEQGLPRALVETITRAQVKTKEAFGSYQIIAEFVVEGKPVDLLRAALEAAERQLVIAMQYTREAKRDAVREEKRQRKLAGKE